jgi:hypothetical protein
MELRQTAAICAAAILASTPVFAGCGRYGPPIRPVAAGTPAATRADSQQEPSPPQDDYLDNGPVPYMLEGLVGEETDLEPAPDPAEAETDAKTKNDGDRNEGAHSDE